MCTCVSKYVTVRVLLFCNDASLGKYKRDKVKSKTVFISFCG